MKVGALIEVLRPYAAVLAAHESALATRINALGDVWAPIMSWNVKDLLRRAWPAGSLPDADEASVEEFGGDSASERRKSIAKQDIVTDLSAIVGALEPHDRKDLDAFVTACRLALEAAQAGAAKPKSSKASAHAQIVNEARGEEIVQQQERHTMMQLFVPLFARISAEKMFTQADLAAIATQFSCETPPKTKRAELLRRI